MATTGYKTSRSLTDEARRAITDYVIIYILTRSQFAEITSSPVFPTARNKSSGEIKRKKNIFSIVSGQGVAGFRERMIFC